jgi:hypothetical protein
LSEVGRSLESRLLLRWFSLCPRLLERWLRLLEWLRLFEELLLLWEGLLFLW